MAEVFDGDRFEIHGGRDTYGERQEPRLIIK